MMNPQVIIRLAILVAVVTVPAATQCDFDVRDGYIIDIHNSEKSGAIFLSDINSRTQEECQNACCNRDEDSLEDGTWARCNLAVFHSRNRGQKNAKNCFLVFCPSEDSCKLSHVRGFTASIVSHTPDQEPTEEEVSVFKPPSPRFLRPDALPVRFHKLRRRSARAKKEAPTPGNAELTKEVQTALKAAAEVLADQAEGEGGQGGKNLAEQEGKTLSDVADNLLQALEGTPAAPSESKERNPRKNPSEDTTPQIVSTTGTTASATSPSTASTRKMTTSSMTSTRNPPTEPHLVEASQKTTVKSQPEATAASPATTRKHSTSRGTTATALSSTSIIPATSSPLAEATPSGEGNPSIAVNVGTAGTRFLSSRSPGSSVASPLLAQTSSPPKTGSTTTVLAVHPSSLTSSSPKSPLSSPPSSSQPSPQSTTINTLPSQPSTSGHPSTQTASSQQPLSQPPPSKPSDSAPSSPLTPHSTQTNPSQPTAQQLSVTNQTVADATLPTNQGTETTQSSSRLPEIDLTSPVSPEKETSSVKLAPSGEPTPRLTSPPAHSAPANTSKSQPDSPASLDPFSRNLDANQTMVANDTAASVNEPDSDEGYSEPKSTRTVIASNGALIAAVCFGILFLLAVLVVMSKHWYGAYQRRHYSKVDYLINGMYK